MRGRFGRALAQLKRARVYGSDFRRAAPFGGNQRWAEGKQEFQFAFALHRRIGESWNQCEPSAQMSDRFAIFGAFASAQARGKPTRNCPFGDSGFCLMMRNEFGSVTRRLRKAILEHFGNSQMQLAPTAAQEGFICYFLHQRMLE